jgi:hypothetical protein
VIIFDDRLARLFRDESGANLEHGVGGPEMRSRSAPGFQRSSARFASVRVGSGLTCDAAVVVAARRTAPRQVADFAARPLRLTARGVERWRVGWAAAVFGVRCAALQARLVGWVVSGVVLVRAAGSGRVVSVSGSGGWDVFPA